ncbi:ChaC-like protein [Pseudooceanicola batsensis HTCC2597]|uniref:glutathione-specific gamma-glutamylcyclotransferase n=1 Tax=Pseudooceanicola batsensis (strain ATCC BAA-863 / DSM 15984 / KCTC 12145 / HTCC2597) TaxID=252305 RepID=A3TU54_PSEBH|nr:gamma-glutamylcyclotransferase [Pseudooceanicola batsensis]EAQ05181.1 ChaC-like protein [Pseudooceanicola batsensis HTCC2597]
MPVPDTAFRHHPALRTLIRDPEQSFFRDLDLAELDQRMIDRGVPMPWRRPDEERETLRRDFLAGHAGPVWVFAYGSLMWDPAILFDEVRHARVLGFSRAMCLVDRRGARGSAEAPGLMAGLAEGGTCDGLVFRIPEKRVDHETEQLWRREMIAHAYYTAFAEAVTPQGPVRALCFVADPEAEMIDVELSHAQQVEYIATGEGFLGTSYEYLENTLAHFDAMQVEDPALRSLLHDVQRRRGAA